MEKSPSKCPKGLKKFSRMVEACNQCRLGKNPLDIVSYNCPYGLEEVTYDEEIEKEGGES